MHTFLHNVYNKWNLRSSALWNAFHEQTSDFVKDARGGAVTAEF
jgi:hypothetical protein